MEHSRSAYSIDRRPLTESARCSANRRYHEAWGQETTLAAESVYKSTALATAVTNSSECSRLYCAKSTTKLVSGRVLEVIVRKTETRQSSTSLYYGSLWRQKVVVKRYPLSKLGMSGAEGICSARVQSSSYALPPQGPIAVVSTAG